MGIWKRKIHRKQQLDETVSSEDRDTSHQRREQALQRAAMSPHDLSPDDVISLQESMGNRAVNRLLSSRGAATVQPKLEVGAVGDKYEQEADHVAHQVRQKADHQAGFRVDSHFENKLAQTQGGGKPLSADLRRDLEPKLKADLSQVKIHTDSEAAGLSKQIQAKAFTHGRDIYMGQGQYQPDSSKGKKLLAHEVTHTVQQTGGGAGVQRMVDNKIQREKEPTFDYQIEGSKDGDGTIPTLFANKAYWQDFKDFAIKEANKNEVDCYEAIDAYKQNPSLNEAQEIYTRFLWVDSKEQVNVSNSKGSEVKQKIDQSEIAQVQPPADLFNNVESDVALNLGDIYGRWSSQKREKEDGIKWWLFGMYKEEEKLGSIFNKQFSQYDKEKKYLGGKTDEEKEAYHLEKGLKEQGHADKGDIFSYIMSSILKIF